MTTVFSEQHLCYLFDKWIGNNLFRSFSEYESWDIVLERNDVLWGVQAKLKMNKRVITQCLNAYGTHFKVILLATDEVDDDWLEICDHLRILVYGLEKDGESFSLLSGNWLFYYRHRPKTLLKIPKFDYSLPAGVKSPRTVSEKKIIYCKLEQIARRYGGFSYIIARDFGLRIIPKLFFRYDFEKRVWVLREKYYPSKMYPHIYDNLKPI